MRTTRATPSVFAMPRSDFHLHRGYHRGLVDREHRAREVPARPGEVGRIGEVPVTQEKRLECPGLDPGLPGKDPHCRRRGRQSHDPAPPESGMPLSSASWFCRCRHGPERQLRYRVIAGSGAPRPAGPRSAGKGRAAHRPSPHRQAAEPPPGPPASCRASAVPPGSRGR